jgi:hypothetical protein
MFTAKAGSAGESYHSFSGSLIDLYRIWLELSDAEQETANIRIDDRRLLEPADIVALGKRADLPSPEH